MGVRALQLDRRDNVLIALPQVRRRGFDGFQGIPAWPFDVPAKHKFAIHDLEIGDPIYMYGVTVAKAVEPIRAGQLLSTRNVRHEAASFHENLRIHSGCHQTFPSGRARRSSAIAARTAKSALAIIGWLFLLFFVRTAISAC